MVKASNPTFRTIEYANPYMDLNEMSYSTDHAYPVCAVRTKFHTKSGIWRRMIGPSFQTANDGWLRPGTHRLVGPNVAFIDFLPQIQNHHQDRE